MSIIRKDNKHHWPSMLVELAAVIGDDATIALFDRFKGRHLSVPQTPIPEHPIEQAIGRAAFKVLCRAYQNELLFFPVCIKLQISERNQAILADHGDGMNVCDIATKYSLTERHITNIISKHRKATHEPRSKL